MTKLPSKPSALELLVTILNISVTWFTAWPQNQPELHFVEVVNFGIALQCLFMAVTKKERKEFLKPAFPLRAAHRLDLIPCRNAVH